MDRGSDLIFALLPFMNETVESWILFRTMYQLPTSHFRPLCSTSGSTYTSPSVHFGVTRFCHPDITSLCLGLTFSIIGKIIGWVNLLNLYTLNPHLNYK